MTILIGTGLRETAFQFSQPFSLQPAVPATAPTNTGAPSITYTALTPGSVLTAVVGSWNWKGQAQGVPAFDIVWIEDGIDTATTAGTFSATLDGKAYGFKVRARNALGELSPWYTSATVAVAADTTAPTLNPPALNTTTGAIDVTNVSEPGTLFALINYSPTILSGAAIEAAVAGPELVTNGGFDADANWTKNTGWTISGGQANYDGGAPTLYNKIRQDAIPTTIGSTFIASMYLTAIAGGSAILWTMNNSSLAQVGVSAPGPVHLSFTSGAATTDIAAQENKTANTLSIDNISLRELLATEAAATFFPVASGANAGAIDKSGVTAGTAYLHLTIKDAAGNYSTDIPTAFTQPSTFSPLDLFAAGEKGIWFDPSDITSLWTDAGTTQVTVDGDVIGQMDDLSGNAKNATQTTAGLKPLYKVDGNGNPYILWDSVDDLLNLPDAIGISGSANRSLFIAGKLPAFEIGNGAGALRRWTLRQESTATNLRVEIQTRGYTSAFNAAGPDIFGIVLNGTTLGGHTLHRGLSTEAATGTDSVNTTDSASAIGVVGNGGTYYAMECYGLLYIDRALTSAEISDLKTYLANKAGITLV